MAIIPFKLVDIEVRDTCSFILNKKHSYKRFEESNYENEASFNESCFNICSCGCVTTDSTCPTCGKDIRNARLMVKDILYKVGSIRSMLSKTPPGVIETTAQHTMMMAA